MTSSTRKAQHTDDVKRMIGKRMSDANVCVSVIRVVGKSYCCVLAKLSHFQRAEQVAGAINAQFPQFDVIPQA